MKKKVSKTTKYTKRNKKIAENRGTSWKQNLVKGKYEIENNPTVLKKLRVNLAISQTALAKDFGISLAGYGMIERGDKSVKKPMAKFISEYFKSKQDVIFKEDKEKFLAKKLK